MNTGLLRLLSIRDQLEAVGADMAAERPRFNALRRDPGARAVSAFNLFQTPEGLAERMASMIPDGAREILEPSAGLGRLYRAARAAQPSARITLVESSADCCAELYRATESDGCADLVQRDFLTHQPGPVFDCVIMNPPYKQGRDIKHTKHAAAMLKPGGVLIGLCLDGPRQADKLAPECSTWEPLGRDIFKSEGTRAPVVLFTIER